MSLVSNPESVNTKPELGFIRMRCNKCGRCVKACPEGAVSVEVDGEVRIDRTRCNGCGLCVEPCHPEALSVYGKEMTVREVMDTVLLDDIYYRSSGGGVTASGGEALEQASFPS